MHKPHEEEGKYVLLSTRSKHYYNLSKNYVYHHLDILLFRMKSYVFFYDMFGL